MDVGNSGPDRAASEPKGDSKGRGRWTTIFLAALRVLSLCIASTALIYLVAYLIEESKTPRKPSVAEELRRLRSEGIQDIDVTWENWRTRLEGESLSRALAALETASEPLWIGWSGEEWIRLGKISMAAPSG
jgi:hypothetical protein